MSLARSVQRLRDSSAFKPGPAASERAGTPMLDDLIPWGRALQTIRTRNA
jgi:hypothetical protein